MRRHHELSIEAHQRVNAATRPARQDAGQATGGLLGKAHRETRDNQHVVRLGDFASESVVFLDRLEFVSQVRLENRFHVLGQVGQSLLDVSRLGPDSIRDHQLVVVG